MSDLPRLPAAEPVTLTGVSLYLRELDAYLAEKFADPIQWYLVEDRYASRWMYDVEFDGWKVEKSDDYSFWLGDPARDEYERGCRDGRSEGYDDGYADCEEAQFE